MKPPFKRIRLLVDPSFQFGLLIRMLFYLLLWTVVAFHISFIFHLYGVLQPGLHRGVVGLYTDFLVEEKPLLSTLIVLTPLLLYDLLKFSNRIAGPLFRCRRVMREMAAGNTVPEFKPRKHDLMANFFEDFNALIKAWNAQITAKRNGSPGGRHPAEAQAQEGVVCGDIN